MHRIRNGDLRHRGRAQCRHHPAGGHLLVDLHLTRGTSEDHVDAHDPGYQRAGHTADRRPHWPAETDMTHRAGLAATDGPELARPRRDEGATLIVALIFTTVVSMVIAVVLSFADTSVRTTLALRDQGAETAAADGAAQVAINQLRLGTYDGTGGGCFQGSGPSNELRLSNFYQAQTGPLGSAVVTCELDPDTSDSSGLGYGPANTPQNAILTLGSAAGEDGIVVDSSNGRSMTVHG